MRVSMYLSAFSPNAGKNSVFGHFLRSEYVRTENVKHLRIRADYLTNKDFQKTTTNEKIL